MKRYCMNCLKECGVYQDEAYYLGLGYRPEWFSDCCDTGYSYDRREVLMNWFAEQKRRVRPSPLLELGAELSRLVALLNAA